MGSTIVVAEDEEGIRDLLEVALRELNFNVISTGGGAECLRVLATLTPQMVILDMNMPGINGLEVLARMRSEERLKKVPVVMQTANNSPEHVKKAIEMGAVDYIVKPIDFSLLGKRISAHIFDSKKLTPIVGRLHMPDPLFARTALMDNFFRFYQVKSGSKTMAVLLPKNISVQEALASEETLAIFVNVFERMPDLSWELIWPRVGGNADGIRRLLNGAPEEIVKSAS